MESFKKLSIQVGLNGLSFCILDTVNNSIVTEGSHVFEIEQTPYLLLKELKTVLEKNGLIGKQFSEVITVHRNKDFSLIPKALFNKNNLRDYLKFNANVGNASKLVYDDLENLELINVYNPFNKINDYIFEVFGESKFFHSGTIFLQTFLKKDTDLETQCFVNVMDTQMELMVKSERKLLLYNQHDFATKEDFLYHILFTFEQLKLNHDKVKLKLFGLIDENDALFKTCGKYIRNIALIDPINPSLGISKSKVKSLDFTVLNSL